MKSAEFMDVREVADRLGVSRARVYQLAQDGEIPHVRRGRRVVVPRDAWEKWMARLAEEAMASTRKGGA